MNRVIYPRYEFTFSTLPRVELPGANELIEFLLLFHLFQYPTSGRTAWSRPGCARPGPGPGRFQYPTSGRTAWSFFWGERQHVTRAFSTLPRVELPGA